MDNNDSKENVLRAVSEYQDIKGRAELIICEHLKITKGREPLNFCVRNVEVNSQSINLVYTTSCMGECDTDYHDCPIECLWNDNWREDLIEQLRKKGIAKQTIEAREKERRRLRLIEEEKRKLAELQAKYPTL